MSKEIAQNKQWEKYDNALDKLVFNGKAGALLNSILDDYTPKKGESTGLSLRTILKAIKFFLTNPLKTLDLIGMATSGTLQDPEFQKHLLSKDQFWNAVKNQSPELLPKFGKILASSTKTTEFQEGNILDEYALKNIAAGLKDDKIINNIRYLTKEALSKNPNYTKIAISALGTISNDKNLTNYMQNRGEAISRYISSKLVAVNSQDVQRVLDNLKKTSNYANIEMLHNTQFIEKFNALVSNNINNKNDTTKQQTLENIKEFKDISSKPQQILIQQLAQELVNQVKPPLQETYGIGQDAAKTLTKIVPTLLKEPRDLEIVLTSFNEKGATQAAMDLLAMVDKNPQIKNYFQESREVIVGILDKIVENKPSLKKLDLKGELYNIVPQLLEHSKELIDIIKYSETKEYEKGAEAFLEIVKNDKNIQQYFISEGKSFIDIAKKGANFNNPDIKNDIGDIFEILMKEKNLNKVQNLLNIYQNKQYTKLITESCKMIENDQQFAKYMNDNSGSLKKIVEIAIDNTPALKANLNGIEIGEIATTMLTKPKIIREVIEGYENSMLSGLYRGTKALITDQKLRNLIGSTLQQGISNAIYGNNNKTGADLLTKIAKSDKKQVGFDLLIEEATKNSNAIKDIKKLLEKKDLFNNIKISGDKSSLLKLEDITIRDQQFISSEFNSVSFNNSILENVAFNNSKFNEVSFKGATMNGTTLLSMLPQIQSNKISLNGTKIVGSLANLDLSNVSLEGSDLSEVTSFFRTNLNNTNLKNATLPKDINVLTEAFNIDKVIIPSNTFNKELIHKYHKELVNTTVDTISRTIGSSNNLGTPLNIDMQNELKQKLNFIINKNDSISKFLIDSIQLNTMKIIDSDCVVDNSIKHVSDYKGTKQIIDSIMKNRDLSADELRNKMINIKIAEDVTQKLFNKGENRGQDGLLVHNIIERCSDKFLKTSSNKDLSVLLNNEQFTQELHKAIYSKSNYTLAGKITGGIQLNNEILNDIELQNTIVDTMIQQINISKKLNDKEHSQIKDIATKIGYNLFGDGINGDRKEDLLLIEKAIQKSCINIKQKNNIQDISTMLAVNNEEIASNNKNASETSLTTLFYDNSKYTKAGYLTGGIYLPQDKIDTSQFDLKLQDVLNQILNCHNASLRQQNTIANYIHNTTITTQPTNINPTSTHNTQVSTNSSNKQRI